jgi:hypothetical protein
VAAGPVFAQEIALTRGKPQCPPGEPDSLQISWTAPCDSGTWLFEPGVGCRMWDWHPEPEDSVVWRGACRAGLPDGKGEAQWFEHGRPIDRFIGTYVNGKREGEGHYQWNDTVRFDGFYANDLPQGYGVVEIEGETVAATGTRAASRRRQGRGDRRAARLMRPGQRQARRGRETLAGRGVLKPVPKARSGPTPRSDRPD